METSFKNVGCIVQTSLIETVQDLGIVKNVLEKVLNIMEAFFDVHLSLSLLYPP